VGAAVADPSVWNLPQHPRVEDYSFGIDYSPVQIRDIFCLSDLDEEVMREPKRRVLARLCGDQSKQTPRPPPPPPSGGGTGSGTGEASTSSSSSAATPAASSAAGIPAPTSGTTAPTDMEVETAPAKEKEVETTSAETMETAKTDTSPPAHSTLSVSSDSEESEDSESSGIPSSEEEREDNPEENPKSEENPKPEEPRRFASILDQLPEQPQSNLPPLEWDNISYRKPEDKFGKEYETESVASTVQPDPNDEENMQLKEELRAGPPPTLLDNPERYAIIDAEYASLSGDYSRRLGSTLHYLKRIWATQAQKFGITWAQLAHIARRVGGSKRGRVRLDSPKRRWEILWIRELAWAFMSPDGSKIVWDGTECHMPLSLNELRAKHAGCNPIDYTNFRHNNKHVHYLPYEPEDPARASNPLDAIRRFMAFCIRLGVKRIFLKGNGAEADRLRGWFHIADPTFAVPLVASPDWRYVAPKWRSPESLQTYVDIVRAVMPKHAHRKWNDEHSAHTLRNEHCSIVECLYYMTHYKFKSEKQNYDIPHTPPQYKHYDQLDQIEAYAISGGAS
jgi:hypothetical protein